MICEDHDQKHTQYTSPLSTCVQLGKEENITHNLCSARKRGICNLVNFVQLRKWDDNIVNCAHLEEGEGMIVS